MIFQWVPLYMGTKQLIIWQKKAHLGGGGTFGNFQAIRMLVKSELKRGPPACQHTIYKQTVEGKKKVLE